MPHSNASLVRSTIERSVLEKPCYRSCRKLLKGRHRTIPLKTKALLIQAVLVKKGARLAKSLLSPNAQPGTHIAVISETIADTSWPDVVNLWLPEHTFLELSRAVAPRANYDKILAFMIVLHNCRGDLDVLRALYKACMTIVKGKRLFTQYLRSFDFVIFGREELRSMKHIVKDNIALFKKCKLKVKKDLLAIIHVKSCYPFGSTLDQDIDTLVSSPNDMEGKTEEVKEEEEEEDEEEEGKEEEKDDDDENQEEEEEGANEHNKTADDF